MVLAFSAKEIHLHLTLPEFEALRNFFNPATTTKVVGPEMENVVMKILEIDTRLNEARRLAKKFGGRE